MISLIEDCPSHLDLEIQIRTSWICLIYESTKIEETGILKEELHVQDQYVEVTAELSSNPTLIKELREAFQVHSYYSKHGWPSRLQEECWFAYVDRCGKKYSMLSKRLDEGKVLRRVLDGTIGPRSFAKGGNNGI